MVWRGQGWWPRHPGSYGLRAFVREIPGLQNVRLREILILKKAQVYLTPYRSLKVKNTQNRDFLFCRVITKIRGIIEKSQKTI